jgi:hypothetical protein
MCQMTIFEEILSVGSKYRELCYYTRVRKRDEDPWYFGKFCKKFFFNVKVIGSNKFNF